MSKTAPVKTTPPTKQKEEVKDHFVLRIPRFKQVSLNMYLVFVIIIFAFILGMLTNKVLYLEKQVKDSTTAANDAPADAQGTLPSVAPPPQVVDVENGNLPFLGKNDAKVTIVEFSDLQCPFCKSYFDETHKQIVEKYVDTGKAKFYFRHFPLVSIHPNAQKASEATECANEQNKFWEYHDKLFAVQDTWSPQTTADVQTSFVDYAGELSLNTDQFATCLESGKYQKAVEDDLAAGEKVQVDGTPAFFVNGNRLTGAQPFSEFERVIEQEMKK